MPVVKFSLLFVFFSQAQNILSKCYTPREMDFKKKGNTTKMVGS